MTAQTLLWTALPTGIRNGALTLTALLTPRLDPGQDEGTLDAFDFGLSWPEVVASASWVVRFSNGTSAAASLASQVDPALWHALFTRRMPVRRYAFDDFGQWMLRSFDAAALAQAVHDLYAVVATTSPAAPPSILQDDAFGTLIDQIGAVADMPGGASPGDPIYATMTPAQRAAYDFESFYHRYEPQVGASLPVRKKHASLEFHEVVSLLGDFPFLLRKLGLAFDLTVPLTAAVAAVPATGTVQVMPQWASGGLAASATRTEPMSTAYDLRVTAPSFRAADRLDAQRQIVGDFAQGMLRLDSSSFQVQQGELDGAASKAIDFCTSMRRVRHGCATGALSTAALPALLPGGLTVVRSGRRAQLLATFAQWRARNDDLPGAAPTYALYSDDLVRGYRVDVKRNDDPWRSLCARLGTVTIAGTVLPIPAGEGYVKAASGSARTLDGKNVEHAVHEALFGWEGWSLAAPRPGRTIVDPTDTAHAGPTHVARIASQSRATDPAAVTSEVHAAPGTLPRLRYKDRYQLRARTVDLAGNSLSLAEADATHATVSQVYQRFEPVPSPVLLLTQEVLEGESLEHMVIRRIEPDDAFAPFRSLARAQCERHVAPPKATQAMAETHGMLDGLSRDAAYRTSLREEGTFLDRVAYDASGTSVPVTSIRIAGPGTPAFPAQRGDPLPPGQYVVHEGAEVRIPYLADPFAYGVAVWGNPGNASRPFAVDGAWPNLRSFKIRLADAQANPLSLQPGSGTDALVVALPPGTMQRVSYASVVAPANLDAMWAWGLMTASLADRVPRMTAAAAMGRLWMITPSREITLVHAVQKPVTAPSVLSATTARAPGATYVDYTQVALALHAPSTGHVDVTASWTELGDGADGLRTIAQSGHAFTLSVAYDDDGAFPKAPAVVRGGPFPGGACPPPATSTSLGAAPLRQELGDTRHRVVQLQATGTTRYREFYPAALTADATNLQRTGAALGGIHVLSTAAPDAPKVAYILPTFDWQADSASRRRRLGGGLRIYLERPWFSSGEGELLAVLVAAPGTAVSEANRKYVSEWGLDPLASSPAPLAQVMTPAHFVKAAGDPFPRTQSGVMTLAEEPTVSVVAVAYPVKWSAERALWFCDIEIDAGTAFAPFVRLALARYQPFSIDAPGVALSRVVRADFAQLTPDRTASMTLQSPTAALVTVTGPGSVSSHVRRTMRAQVERRPRLGSDLAWVATTTLDLASSMVKSGLTTWTGVLPFPAGYAADTASEYRVAVREIEEFPSASGAIVPGAPGRVVYADELSLTR